MSFKVTGMKIVDWNNLWLKWVELKDDVMNPHAQGKLMFLITFCIVVLFYALAATAAQLHTSDRTFSTGEPKERILLTENQ